MRLSRTIIPNAITLLSMVVGFASVTEVLQGHLLPACWLLAAAALLDVLDGRAATMLHATSEFGGVLDSFNDLSVFCFAPSVLVYQAFFTSWGIPGIVVSSLPLLCGALRLTRFSFEDREIGSSAYVGLTTPIANGILVGFVILTEGKHADPLQSVFAAALTICASALMVSTIHYDTSEPFHPPAILAKWRGYWLITFLPAAVIFPRYAVFLWTTAFALYGVLRALFTALLARIRGRVGEEGSYATDLAPALGTSHALDSSLGITAERK